MSKEDPLDKGELLPREEPGESLPSEEKRPTETAPARRRERKGLQEEREEITERGMLIEMMGKMALHQSEKDGLMKLFLKAREGEGHRSVDLLREQRNFISLLTIRERQQNAYVEGLLKSHVDNTNRIGDLQAKAPVGKLEEIAGALVLLSQIPIFNELQEIALEAIKKRRAKKARPKFTGSPEEQTAALKKWLKLQRELKELEKKAEPEEEPEEEPTEDEE